MKNKMNKTRRFGWNRQTLLLVSIVSLLVCAVSGTLAYLIDTDGPVENVFTPGKVEIEVDEPGWNNEIKNNVSIKNTGNVDAKIRAMVVVTWQGTVDGKTVIYPQKPVEGTDYKITWIKTGWSDPETENGWYTHDDAVAPGNITGILFTFCEPVDANTPNGYHLVVDVIAEAIQADGNASW